MIPTSAMAQRWQTILKTNEVSPFDGVLVPHETYRKMSDESLEYDIMTNRYQECLNRERESAPDFDWEVIGMSFGFGLSFGLILKEVLK